MARNKTVRKAIETHCELIKNASDRVHDLEFCPENVPKWIKKTPEYWSSFAHGCNTILETILHDSNSYRGFCYIAKNGEQFIPLDHPEFAEWRRQYF